ncbi:MAG: hypothetical protein H6974_05860 [Gammaproteobacteria bacterium]|nr:hypothetical protein [Gammaproteobacteria bacterium]
MRFLISFILLIFLWIPLFQTLTGIINIESIHEHSKSLLSNNMGFSWSRLRDGSWQKAVEANLIQRIGFRPILIRFSNQLRLSFFPNSPSKHYIFTSSLGFVPLDTVRRLNGDLRNRAAIEREYAHASERFAALSSSLSNLNIPLVAVLAPPKARVYPEALEDKYLLTDASKLLSSAASFSRELESQGVAVLDFQDIFRQWKSTINQPLYASTGFHWNYYAACLASQVLIDRVSNISSKPFMQIDCSDVEMEISRWADNDILWALNTLSFSSYVKKAPFPRPKKVDSITSFRKFPRFLFVGDSYANMLIYNFVAAFGPKSVIYYEYMKNRFVYQDDYRPDMVHYSTLVSAKSLAEDLLNIDAVVLVISDGNLPRSSAVSGDFGLFDLLSLPTVVQPDTKEMKIELILGNWKYQGKSASIAATDLTDVVVCTNELNASVEAKIESGQLLWAMDWDIYAVLSGDGKELRWSNGSIWTR